MKLTGWVLKKTDTLHKDNLEFVRKFDSNVTLSPHKIKRRHLKFLQVLILKIIDLFQRIIFKDNTFSKLLLVDKESKFLIKYHCKIQKLRDSEVTSPFVLTGENVNKIGTKHLFKSIKSKSRSGFINKLNISIENKAEIYANLPVKVKKLIDALYKSYSGFDVKKIKVEDYLDFLQRMKNSRGENVLDQLSELYIKKSEGHLLLNALITLQISLRPENEMSVNLEKLASFKESDLLRLGLADCLSKKCSRSELEDAILRAIKNEEKQIQAIDLLFKDIYDRVDQKLSVFEVSSARLEHSFPKNILQKPIDVTMIGVEYSGLIKEGGLAEAIEGMSKALKTQHVDNKVRVIFPKYSNLPKNIQEKINQKEPIQHHTKSGESFNVYKIDHEGLEFIFIDHPSFIIKGVKPSIYGPDEKTVKLRFTTFSKLAAEVVQTLKTDVIHLHDWHVGGVALKLAKENKESWGKGATPPVVFTYHNNSRPAQGIFSQDIYNYTPIINGLIEAGIASENTNVFAEIMKVADAVSTVSETYGVESQDMQYGHGVSFAVRNAAALGKLTGIVNGSNPKSWDPESDGYLKNWKDPTTAEPIDLTYGPNNTDLEINNQKNNCKVQLQKWIKQNFPDRTFDANKPIVTYVGRFDTYQKGIEKLERALKSTLKNGGQFIIMGSLEDRMATQILDQLESKYKDNVLIIRDYKSDSGRYYYQQGDKERQGCGSLIRAASDFVLIPSNFEPCGLVQFESWLFGALAIGSNVGGLADTIIPKSKDKTHFNGYLFGTEKNGLESTLSNALSSWADYSDEQKGALAKRLMATGKKYSWSTAPVGYSPVEKYRFVYENAVHFSKSREMGPENHIDLVGRLSVIRDRTFHKKVTKLDTLSEEYYIEFNKKKVNFSKLEKLYKKLPVGLRISVPSPYPGDISFNKYEALGSHLKKEGVEFALEAPEGQAVKVRVFSKEGFQDFPLEKGQAGIWTLFVPGLREGAEYQFLVNGVVKIDPYGLSHVSPPRVEEVAPRSVVAAREYKWEDTEWMNGRINNASQSKPVSIFEVHPLSWKKKDGVHMNYRELAHHLVEYCQKMGYSHIELMGILEHPDERSFGYQVTGFFAPTSRMGSIDDFKYMVNYLHQNKLGVYLDWVPAHFAKDSFGLKSFDGSKQFEPSKAKLLFSLRNLAFKWGTYFFDYSKKRVCDFLISSAAYWVKEMHVDGLRVDAVRSMRLSEDPANARSFLRNLNAVIHREFPGTMMMAEDYSNSLTTTRSLGAGGLGFDQKWNISWMHHTLQYFSVKPKDRSKRYSSLIQSIEGDSFHKMIMALSHDEVKSERKQIIDKTPGLSDDQKLSNIKSLFGFMMSIPGKKLSFMGNEWGMSQPWEEFIGRSIGIMDLPLNEVGAPLRATISHLHSLYKTLPALSEYDDNANDLVWIEKRKPDKNLLAFRRTSDSGDSIACLHNFSEQTQRYFVPLQNKPQNKQLMRLASEWVKKRMKNSKDILKNCDQLSLLANYPIAIKKILNSESLRNEFFSWTLKDEGSIQEYFMKMGWEMKDFNPKEVFNSDDKEFGGKGGTNPDVELKVDERGNPEGYFIDIPPMSNVFISEFAPL